MTTHIREKIVRYENVRQFGELFDQIVYSYAILFVVFFLVKLLLLLTIHRLAGGVSPPRTVWPQLRNSETPSESDSCSAIANVNTELRMLNDKSKTWEMILNQVVTVADHLSIVEHKLATLAHNNDYYQDINSRLINIERTLHGFMSTVTDAKQKESRGQTNKGPKALRRRESDVESTEETELYEVDFISISIGKKGHFVNVCFIAGARQCR